MKTRSEMLLHPVRMRILQHLTKNGSATTGSIAKIMPDVPRTTLYRHLNLLQKEGYLKIAKEIKVRGTYEREYKIDEAHMRGRTQKEKERQATFDLLLRMIGDFEEYYEEPESDAGRDMLFFTGNTLRLSDEEFTFFLQELFTLLAKYDALSGGEDQKPRSITMISAPVREEKEAAGQKR